MQSWRGTRLGQGTEVAGFLLSVGIGLVGSVVGTALLWLLSKLRLDEVLGTAELAVVIAVAAACDILRDDTGLVAAILMGLAVSNVHGFDILARRPFFETLVQLMIGLLFVSISATVTPASARAVVLPALVLAAILNLVPRPMVAFLCTVRTCRPASEVSLAGWPRAASSPPQPPRPCRPHAARRRRRRQDPAGDVRHDRGDGDRLRPDRGASGAAPWRHPPGPQQAASLVTRAANDAVPAGYDLLLLVRARWTALACYGGRNAGD